MLINQVLFTGFEALAPVLVSSFLLGGLVAYTGRTFLTDLGQNQLIYDLIIMAVVRDVGPLITGLIILLRSGTAITTELGSMRVNREIDALETMGISSISYLVVPRVMGMVFSLLILGAYFTLMGLFGAYATFFWLAKIPFTDFSCVLPMRWARRFIYPLDQGRPHGLSHWDFMQLSWTASWSCSDRGPATCYQGRHTMCPGLALSSWSYRFD